MHCASVKETKRYLLWWCLSNSHCADESFPWSSYQCNIDPKPPFRNPWCCYSSIYRNRWNNPKVEQRLVMYRRKRISRFPSRIDLFERATELIQRREIDIELGHFVHSSGHQKRPCIKQLLLIACNDGKKREKSGGQQNISVHIPIEGGIHHLFRCFHYKRKNRLSILVISKSLMKFIAYLTVGTTVRLAFLQRSWIMGQSLKTTMRRLKWRWRSA